MSTTRELSDRIEHPEFLLGDCTRLDPAVFPAIRQVYDGAPTLGWEGDPRLCFYHGPEARYYLFRLEHDGQYRMVCRSAPFGVGMMNEEGIHKLIRRLQAIDTWRGFDPLDATLGATERRQEQSRQEFRDMIHEETAPRLAYWAQRAYLPGVDIRPRLR